MSRQRRGRGEGGIYQRADGRWVASISLGYNAEGKRKRRVVYGKSKREVQEKIRALHDQGMPRELAKLTVEGYLTKWLELVKPALGAAVDEEMLPFDPAAGSQAESGQTGNLSLRRGSGLYLLAKEDRLYAFYVIAIDTGARPGELFALEWTDIDFERGRMTIKKSLALNRRVGRSAFQMQVFHRCKIIARAKASMAQDKDG